jgi:hypothetical protein
MEYKSQYSQDKWIIEEVFPNMTNGYFVELAAGDGVFLSNTHILEKHFNWQGLCIEPNKSSYQNLINNRNCLFDDSVILQDGFEIEFVEYHKLTDYEHLLSGILGAQNANLPIERVTKHIASSLDTVLDKHKAPEVIHYISMDIEGSEIYVLQDFLPKNKRTILAWSIECNPGSQHEKEIIDWMTAYNYDIIKKDGTNGRLGHDYLFLHKQYNKI